jgi:alpha-N-arabinofuranosidase
LIEAASFSRLRGGGAIRARKILANPSHHSYKQVMQSSAAPSSIIHVAPTGDDSNDGSVGAPLRTIGAAAERARPGDTVRVGAGVYRERVDPPRGGRSDAERITYQAAADGTVEILGSEPVSGWEREAGTVWKVSVPATVFGGFNPFAERIRGDWFLNMGRPHHTGCVYFDGGWLHEAVEREALQQGFWYAEVGAEATTIWVNFGPNDPNEKETAINVRPTVFYPSRTGIDYITVRGFTLRHAATNWAPPTAEQVGLIGTNWSKGWIIENCTVTHSRCVGITLGKYGDEYDNTSENSAEGYVETIKRAHARGWNRATIGGHIVRNNTVAFCEQAGIVGSLGAIFSEITGNEIHDIHLWRLFNGHEQAGIKLHAPIDTLIAGNHIHRCNRAFWMDWMTQGTRITRNLCHDNWEQDIFVEVNHGPFVVDHNFFLSDMSIWSMSQGGAFLHNFIAGRVARHAELGRETPWHPPHSTEIAGIAHIRGGDERYCNNLFVRAGALKAASGDPEVTRGRKQGELPEKERAFPNRLERNRVVKWDPKAVKKDGGWWLELKAEEDELAECPLVTTATLGETAVSKLPYVDYDGSDLVLDEDFLGAKREEGASLPGPLAAVPEKGEVRLKFPG